MYVYIGVSHVVLVVKNPPANAGDIRDVDSIPGLGRSPGEGNGSPLQYSCQENPLTEDPASLQSVRSQRVGTRLKWLSTHTAYMYVFCTHSCTCLVNRIIQEIIKLVLVIVKEYGKMRVDFLNFTHFCIIWILCIRVLVFWHLNDFLKDNTCLL